MTQFSDLSLDPKVLKAIADAGYETPTPIQAQGIPPALEGRDVLGIAQTGTGKTASFVLPMITLLGRGRARARMPRSLVLAPTRELAAQVAENFDIYAKYTKLTKALLIGGVSFGEQDKLIDRGVDVLIATPGRLLDHFERGKLLLTGVQIMVVDEADRMLDMGFIPDIERIFQLTPFTRQTLFFSATMAPEIERITNTFLTAPARIEVARQATASLTIDQGLVRFKPSRKDQTFAEKRDILRALIRSEGEGCTNAIVFCNRKVDVDVVAKSLKKHGFDAAPIHGDLDQSVRTRTLDGFRDGSIRLLIASDVAARGLDVPAVSHVFNFDVPSHPEDYIHRIGRTGRAGRKGRAITIASPADEKYLAAILDLIKMEIPPMDNPVKLKEAPTETAQGVDPEAGRSEKPARARSRTASRGKGSKAPVAETAVDAAQDSATTVAVEQSQPAPEPPERQIESQIERPADPATVPAAQPQQAAQDQGRGREPNRRPAPRSGARNDNTRRDDRVVGMGDHVPDFLMRSFQPAAES
ncbi:MAG: DEAD/DEAH box helicase [Rhodobacteraceae bacterium]|nr:DEAD/DEAH box helicase [Paracoccaceae bacterium]